MNDATTMRNYIFVVRRNLELSVNEVASYLTARSIPYTLEATASEYAIFNISDFEAHEAMKEIGETLKIGELITSLDTMRHTRVMGHELGAYRERLQASISRIPDNVAIRAHDARLMGVSLYPRESNDYKDFDFKTAAETAGRAFEGKLKKSLSVVSAKDFKHPNRADISPTDVHRKRMDKENLELLVGLEPSVFCVGVTLAVCDQEALDRRGVDRPSRPIDWKYGMAPSYAKALVNLSGAKRGDSLLDPFCGIGTILQEAWLNGVKAIGLDISNSAVSSAKENLRRIGKEYHLNIIDLNRIVIRGDATKLREHFSENSLDAVATEPYLGPALRKRPKREAATEMLSDLRPLYERVLLEMWKVLKRGKRAVVVAPTIRSSNRSVTLNLKHLADRAGFALVKSIDDARAHQLVSREIMIFEKPLS